VFLLVLVPSVYAGYALVCRALEQAKHPFGLDAGSSLDPPPWPAAATLVSRGPYRTGQARKLILPAKRKKNAREACAFGEEAAPRKAQHKSGLGRCGIRQAEGVLQVIQIQVSQLLQVDPVPPEAL